MSVDFKTPTKAQFQHPEFPCGPRRHSNEGQQHHPKPNPKHQRGEGSGHHQGGGPGGGPGRLGRKRRFSEKHDNRHNNNPFKRRFNPHHRREKIVLPTKFLLGGNINDPLNLESLCDEEISKLVNQTTPVSSPVPTPAFKKQMVQVLIPPNITDPLNLNSGEDIELLSPKGVSNKKKRKHKKRKSTGDMSVDGGAQPEAPVPSTVSKDFTRPMTIDIMSPDPEPPGPASADHGENNATTPGSAKSKSFMDKIVSPVIPQISPKSRQRRKRNSSECKDLAGGPNKVLLREDSDKSSKSAKSDKISPHRPKFKRQHSNQGGPGHGQGNKQPLQNPKPRNRKRKVFMHGNYNQYYGYRNSEGEDYRLKCFKKEWFDDKDVLDIGCNIGHITLSVARDFGPKKIVGMDIDNQLINIARRNIRHYITTESKDNTKFPSGMAKCYGPLAAPPLGNPESWAFPNNVFFMQGNYVLERDELLDMTREEYDVIMGLSVTKWMHLNNGDEGLKRAFKRMYRQLRPGGKLILEPQGWQSYKKKKNITETITKNFKSIHLRPEHFREYLLSREVGFSTCEVLKIPQHKAKGFQRPLLVFTKSSSVYPTPYTDYYADTPRFTGEPKFLWDFDSRGDTPVRKSPIMPKCMFTVGSGSGTPYGYGLGSGSTTPYTPFPGSGPATPYAAGSGPNTPRVPEQSAEQSYLDDPNTVEIDARGLEAIRTRSAPALLESQPVTYKESDSRVNLSSIAEVDSPLEADRFSPGMDRAYKRACLTRDDSAIFLNQDSPQDILQTSQSGGLYFSPDIETDTRDSFQKAPFVEEISPMPEPSQDENISTLPAFQNVDSISSPVAADQEEDISKSTPPIQTVDGGSPPSNKEQKEDSSQGSQEQPSDSTAAQSPAKPSS